MTNPKLALIPSGYKGGINPTVYSILPSDGSGDFDYERNGSATRVRKDGLIEEVTDDVPRLDWSDGNCPSLLLESQRTNLITYSEDFSEWSPTNIVLTGDTIIAPDGTTTADKIAGNSVTGQHRVNFTSTNVSGVTTFSFFAKSGEYTSCWARIGLSSAYFDLENGVAQGSAGITSSIENFGNGWYRCIMTKASSSANEVCRINITTSYLDTSDFLGDNTSGIYLWGAQHEVGDYVSSYIKSNSGSTTTRFKDECLNAGDSDLFDITEGTFFVDANNFGTPYLGYNMITLSDGSSNLVRFIYESSRIRTSVENGSIQQDYFIAGVNDNERNKVAITFKENEFKTYLNGVLKDTDLIGVVPTGLDRLNFANQSGTTRHFEGKVYDTRVYDRVLTEAEAIELTTL